MQVKSSAQLLAQRNKHVKIITLIIVIIFILLKIIGENFKIRLNSAFISCFWGGCLAGSVGEHSTLYLRVVSSNPKLGVETT